MRKKIWFVAAVLISVPLVCGGTVPPGYPADQGWPTSSPDAMGISGKALKKVMRDIRSGQSSAAIDSLIIVRNGFLVAEEYFNGYHREKIHTQQSVSKSFTSALIGIALDRGIIKSADQKILDFFPDMKDIEHMDDLKRSLTLKDLLTMRSGTDYHERGPGSPHYRLNSLPRGWDRFYLNRPMVRKPGTHFLYDSGGVILMSAILKNLTGRHADVYADETLFPSLGINKSSWFRNDDSHPHTGGGLSIRPVDMARFGLLYLRNGQWRGKQVVSAEWVRRSFTMHVRFKNTPDPYDVGYGYLWWIMKEAPGSKTGEYIYAAKGFMGQYIFLIPEYDMVVVFTGSSRSRSGMKKPFDILYKQILPAVH